MTLGIQRERPGSDSRPFSVWDDEDRRPFNLGSIVKRDGTLGGNSARVSVINESGMYSLVLSSKKPEAREFKRWVTSEVLP